MNDLSTNGRRHFLFILFAFLRSIPFYAFGDLPVLPEALHSYTPAFVFASVIPVLLANVFLYPEHGWDGVRDLWRNVFDFKRIRNKLCYIPILLLTPATALAAYFLMPLIGRPILDPYFPVLAAPVLFAVFFVFAMGEEAGWSGYVIDGLQNRWSALTSAIGPGARLVGLACNTIRPGSPCFELVGGLAMRINDHAPCPDSMGRTARRWLFGSRVFG